MAIGLERLTQEHSESSIEMQDQIGAACGQLRNLSTDVQELSHNLHSAKLEYLGIAVVAKLSARIGREAQSRDRVWPGRCAQECVER